MLAVGYCRLTGFEPHPDELANLQARAGPGERYLPYAIGDGSPAELRICAYSGWTSLLEPEPRMLELFPDFKAAAQVIKRLPLETVRLDAVADLGEIDVTLRSLGFVPHCFADLRKVWVSPVIGFDKPNWGINQLLEADMVYIRDISNPAGMTDDQLEANLKPPAAKVCILPCPPYFANIPSIPAQDACHARSHHHPARR